MYTRQAGNKGFLTLRVYKVLDDGEKERQPVFKKLSSCHYAKLSSKKLSSCRFTKYDI